MPNSLCAGAGACGAAALAFSTGGTAAVTEATGATDGTGAVATKVAGEADANAVGKRAARGGGVLLGMTGGGGGVV